MDGRRGWLTIGVSVGVVMFVAGIVLTATRTSIRAGHTIALLGLLVFVVAVFMWRFDGLLDGVGSKRSQRRRVVDEYVPPASRLKFLAIAIIWVVGQSLWLGLRGRDWDYAVVTALVSVIVVGGLLINTLSSRRPSNRKGTKT